MALGYSYKWDVIIWEYDIPFIDMITEDEVLERIESMWMLRNMFKILVWKPAEREKQKERKKPVHKGRWR